MKGFVVAEAGHIVNIMPPINATGGVKAQAFSMRDYQHASILLSIGVAAGAMTTIQLFAGTGTALTGVSVPNGVAIPFSVYKQETSGINFDVLGPRVVVPVAGLVPSGNSNIFYVIELDGQELPQGNPWVQLVITNGAVAVQACAIAFLSGARLAEVQSPTETQ
jgi:hypothetical protein